MNEELKSIPSCQEILSMLPHQFPFRLISNIVKYVPRKILQAEFTPSSLHTLFLQFGYVPETILIEGLAQTAVLLTQLETMPLKEGEVPLLGSVEMAAVKQVPWGEAVNFAVEPVRIVAKQAMLKGRATAGSSTLITGTICVAVTSGADHTHVWEMR